MPASTSHSRLRFASVLSAALAADRAEPEGGCVKAMFRAMLVVGACTAAPMAVAQSCAAPAQLTPNTSQWLDTCQGETGLVLACNVFPLYGRAAIVRMELPYPAGLLEVQSMTVGYDPAMFLLRAACNNSAGCGYATNSGTVVDTMDLALVDSGGYFLAIATPYPGTPDCGQVLVTYWLTPEQQALLQDGVFRGGLSAPPILP